MNQRVSEKRESVMDSIRTKTLHTLLGVAYGDAMGMPTENYTRENIALQFGKVTGFMPSPDDGAAIYRKLQAGEVTDDTEHTVFVCESLLEGHGRIAAREFVQRLVNWLEHDEKSQYVVGPSTTRAIKAIEGGMALEEAGKTGTTNGAAMKISPIGLVRPYQKLGELVNQVAEVCLPTHNTRIAIQGAAAIAVAVSYSFDHQSLNWDELYGLIKEAVELAGSHGLSLPGPDLMARIDYGWRLAQTANQEEFLDKLYGFMGTGLETIETVPAALTIIRREEARLSPCVAIAANIGGDTDTIGAICGGICGSNHFDLIPAEQERLEEVNKIDFEGIASRMAELITTTRKVK